VQLEKGWQYMEEGITKLKRILEGEREVGGLMLAVQAACTTILNCELV
jgi:hypothetical protein